MIEKTVIEVAKMLQAEILNLDDVNKKICGVTMDSRQVAPNMLYIPMVGTRVDGHTFVESAIEKGASATLWMEDHRPYPEGIVCVLVKDTAKALQELAKTYLATLDCKVIAVTGSNGKTSCKDMLYSVFSQERKTQKTQGNRNNELGLPLTILDFDEDIEVAILEMGMEYKHDIDFLCSIAQPDISVITTIGTAHMEFFGGKKQIAQSKLEILDNLKENGLFLYNIESPELKECLKEMTIDASKVIASFGKCGDISITSDIAYEEDGISFMTSLLQDRVYLKAFGDFQAMNSLPVIYIARHEGIKEESILKGLKELEITKMRTALISVEKARILDDTYKSNPESAKAAIDTLMKIPAKKHIALLADMLELGPEEDDLHYDVGAYAKEHGVDVLDCTGPISKHMAKAFDGARWFETKEEIVEAVKDYLQQDCVILVKGSRAMAMDKIVNMLREM